MDTEQPPFDLGCINPPMVLGPNLNVPSDVAHLNTSSKVVWLLGLLIHLSCLLAQLPAVDA